MKQGWQSRKPRSQGGFTLVELVIVIAIIGVLAAVALPRFASLQRDARAAKADGFSGAIRSAAAQVKAVSVARGVSCGATIAAAASPVVIEGVQTALAYCYPTAPTTTTATAGTIIDVAAINPTVDQVTLAINGTAVEVQVDGATDPTTCRVSYTAPTAADQPPVVSAVKTGC